MWVFFSTDMAMEKKTEQNRAVESVKMNETLHNAKNQVEKKPNFFFFLQERKGKTTSCIGPELGLSICNVGRAGHLMKFFRFHRIEWKICESSTCRIYPGKEKALSTFAEDCEAHIQSCGFDARWHISTQQWRCNCLQEISKTTASQVHAWRETAKAQTDNQQQEEW